MRLSDLQKYILLECINSKTGRIGRARLIHFYDAIKANKRPEKNLMTKIVTKSIERLIDKELLIGFGERTKYKWFIHDIKITREGKRVAKGLQGEQLKLNFKKKKRSKK